MAFPEDSCYSDTSHHCDDTDASDAWMECERERRIMNTIYTKLEELTFGDVLTGV